MRMCVFPKRYAFNQNEPPSYPFPGELPQRTSAAANRPFQFAEPPQCWDLYRFNPVYFQRLEKRILDLTDGGFQKLRARFTELGIPPIAAGGLSSEACGYNMEQCYYLFYYGLHQPATQVYNLGDDRYQVDVIDTWNMTINTVLEQATGETRVPLPGRKYIAVRIQKI